MTNTAGITSEELKKKRRRYGVVIWIIIAFTILSLIGFLIGIFMIGLHLADLIPGAIVCASSFAGILLFGLLGLLFSRRGVALSEAELDAFECEDSEYSFFAGEGTLATFLDEELYLHGKEGIPGEKNTNEEDREDGEPRSGREKDLKIPYYEIRFFSVCSRRYPQEGGRWSVILEIPARYFNRNAGRDFEPLLVQLDAKERLYRRLEELGLELLGEMPASKREQRDEPSENSEKNPKFEKIEKFTLSDTLRRRKAVILVIIGLFIVIGGTFAAIYWNSSIGAVSILIGGYIAVRALVAYVRAKANFCLYREGIYYSEPSGVENVFLKWEEFSSVCIAHRDGKEKLRVKCPYGAYDFPQFEGAFEAIKKLHPEKAESDL